MSCSPTNNMKAAMLASMSAVIFIACLALYLYGDTIYPRCALENTNTTDNRTTSNTSSEACSMAWTFRILGVGMGAIAGISLCYALSRLFVAGSDQRVEAYRAEMRLLDAAPATKQS